MFVDSAPVFTSCIERSINELVFLAASADLVARLRTSSDTTEKPLPAAPARVASMEALSARRLVCRAISSIVFVILLILAED